MEVRGHHIGLSMESGGKIKHQATFAGSSRGKRFGAPAMFVDTGGDIVIHVCTLEKKLNS